MAQLETNIYEIENLDELNCDYIIYSVRGLDIDSEDYPRNRQFLTDILSRKTQSPCEIFQKGNETFIAQPVGHKELPASMEVVGAYVKIEKRPSVERLDFKNLNPTTERLAKRFLQFYLQTPLKRNPTLWQPESGYPFYHKKPDMNFRNFSSDVDLYRGFSFRVVNLQDGKLGICVDTTSKYISRYPLPTKISRDEFRKFQGQRCIYEYGNVWYEITIQGLNDLNVSEVSLPNGKTLFDDVHEKGGNRKSKNLLSLPKDCSVLIYYNKQNQQRNVPSGLCRLTFGTKHPSIKPFHDWTKKPPHIRRREIRFVVDKYLRNLTFGTTEIKLSDRPVSIIEKRLLIPDLEFGNNKILSVESRLGAIRDRLGGFGKTKKQLLYSEDAGLFIKKPFDRQYIILPKSIYQSSGKKFLQDLQKEVQRLYPLKTGISYNPIAISYDDSVQKSIASLGNQIIRAVEINDAKPGYGVVMIPRLPSKRLKKEDELGNLVMRELRKRGVFVSIIHTDTVEESFEDKSLEGQESNWDLVPDRKQQVRYKGYLKIVALNKILLLNSHWPFVLKTPLNADLTIGIDVKNNTAGFTLVYRNGRDIRFISSDSDQKERLSESYIFKNVVEIIREEQTLNPREIKDIVVHRDGIFYPSERKGIKKAIETLAREETISPGGNVTLLEIRKTAKVPLRLFNIYTLQGTQEERVSNPIIGNYMVTGRNEFFICNTGYPYKRKGTTKPIHVVKLDGNMSDEALLQDFFSLSNLTWTKIDDCSRYPITIKMGDIRLKEIAGDYDEDALKFSENGGDEEYE